MLAEPITTNFTISAGQYIAKLNLNLLKPGFGPVSFTGLDFRGFDGTRWSAQCLL